MTAKVALGRMKSGWSVKALTVGSNNCSPSKLFKTFITAETRVTEAFGELLSKTPMEPIPKKGCFVGSVEMTPILHESPLFKTKEFINVDTPKLKFEDCSVIPPITQSISTSLEAPSSLIFELEVTVEGFT